MLTCTEPEGDTCRTLVIDRHWSGEATQQQHPARLSLSLNAAELVVLVDAPFHGDAPPPQPSGTTPGLWEYEAVEVFILGADDQYLELELGPHGHYLAIFLGGYRTVVWQGRSVKYRARIRDGRWLGEASIPSSWLPHDPSKVNAYSVFGKTEARQYLCCFPMGGVTPDFHRLDSFGPLWGP